MAASTLGGPQWSRSAERTCSPRIEFDFPPGGAGLGDRRVDGAAPDPTQTHPGRLPSGGGRPAPSALVRTMVTPPDPDADRNRPAGVGGELVFTVNGSTVSLVKPINLADAGLRERRDLQEWVISHPAILGPDIMVVTAEFDRWWSGAGRERDRLDVLGLHRSGDLVVAELKRGRAPETVEMQALKYAAMASRFTVEALVQQHLRFTTARQEGTALTVEQARDGLEAWAPDLADDLPRTPQVVIVAEEFPPVVTTTAIFLSETGLNIKLIRVGAYRTPGGEVVITASQLYPVPDVENFIAAPRVEQRRVAAAAKRQRNVVDQLVDAGTPDPGTVLRLRTSGLYGSSQAALEDWLPAQPDDYPTCRWEPDPSAPGRPLVSPIDHQRYSPTGLVKKLLSLAGSEQETLAGPRHWETKDGESLAEIAASLYAE